jgi:hypothetical protein
MEAIMILEMKQGMKQNLIPAHHVRKLDGRVRKGDIFRSHFTLNYDNWYMIMARFPEVIAKLMKI